MNPFLFRQPSLIGRKCDVFYLLWLIRERENWSLDVMLSERFPPGIVSMSGIPRRIYGAKPEGQGEGNDG